MKTNLWLTVLTLALVFNVVMTRTPASGDDCTPGIRKEHLDTTPGAFVDNTTIEINSTNGLQVKDAGITAAKIANLLPTSYAGGQSVTLPNGMIIKSGYKVASGTSATVTFENPPFPHGVISVILTTRGSAGHYGAWDTVSAQSATGFTAKSGEDNAHYTGFNWLAIGY